jgi:hypothetical protein
MGGNDDPMISNPGTIGIKFIGTTDIGMGFIGNSPVGSFTSDAGTIGTFSTTFRGSSCNITSSPTSSFACPATGTSSSPYISVAML